MNETYEQGGFTFERVPNNGGCYSRVVSWPDEETNH